MSENTKISRNMISLITPKGVHIYITRLASKLSSRQLHNPSGLKTGLKKKEKEVEEAKRKKKKKKPLVVKAKKEEKVEEKEGPKENAKASAALGSTISSVPKQRGIQGGLLLNIEI